MQKLFEPLHSHVPTASGRSCAASDQSRGRAPELSQRQERSGARAGSTSTEQRGAGARGTATCPIPSPLPRGAILTKGSFREHQPTLWVSPVLGAMAERGEPRGAAQAADVQTQSAAKHRVLLCWCPCSRAISLDRFILPQILPPAGRHIFSIE